MRRALGFWLGNVSFVFICVAVGFIMEVLFDIQVRRSDDSDGTDSAGMGF